MVFVQLDANQVEQINDLFDRLTYEEMRGVIRGSLSTSASILKKQTIRNINKCPFEKSDDMEGYQGVRHRVRLMGVDSSFAVVHLWSWNRIFETGSEERITQKGKSRGKVKGYYFFDLAKKQTENEVFEAMYTRVLKKIDKAWNKRMI